MKEIYTRPWGRPTDCCDNTCSPSMSSPIKYIPVARGTSVTFNFNLKRYSFTYDDIKQLTFTLKKNQDIIYCNLFTQDGRLDPAFAFNQDENIIEFTLNKDQTASFEAGDIFTVESIVELKNGKTYLDKQPSIKVIDSIFGDLIDAWNGGSISGHIRGNYWYSGDGYDDTTIKADIEARKDTEKIYPLSGDLYLCTLDDNQHKGVVCKLGTDGIWRQVVSLKGAAGGADGDSIVGAGFDENGQMYLEVGKASNTDNTKDK